jgi:alpha-mannosidase
MTSAHACYANGGYLDSNSRILTAMQLRAELNAHEWIYEITRGWARDNLEDDNYQQIAIFNTSDSDQDVWIEFEPNLDLDEWGDRWLCDSNGEVVPMQLLQPEAPDPQLTRILFRAKLKARQCARYFIRDFNFIGESPVSQTEGTEEDSFRIIKTTLENSEITLRFSQQAITRITSSINREQNYLGRLGMSFSLFHDKNDSSVTGTTEYELPFAYGFDSNGWEEEEKGLLRIGMINRGMINQSRVEWRVRFYRDDDRIFHSFRIHFQEREKALQLNIQLEEAVEYWMDATSGGFEQRKCSNTEVPFHGWTRGINKDHEFAVVSRDLFSFSHDERNLSFTVLRSSEVARKSGVEEPGSFPRKRYTDQGVYELEFIIIPQSKGRDLQLELENLKNPPIVMDRYEGMNRPPWKNSPPSSLQEKNEERAKMDGRMNHLSES